MLISLVGILILCKTIRAEKDVVKHLLQSFVEQLLVVNIYSTDIFFSKTFNGI